MQAAQEFMTFLVDQTETKLGEIKKQTSGESTKFVVEEVTVYIKKLREVIPMAFGAEAEPSPAPAPAPAQRGNGRRGQNA